MTRQRRRQDYIFIISFLIGLACAWLFILDVQAKREAAATSRQKSNGDAFTPGEEYFSNDFKSYRVSAGTGITGASHPLHQLLSERQSKRAPSSFKRKPWPRSFTFLNLDAQI